MIGQSHARKWHPLIGEQAFELGSSRRVVKKGLERSYGVVVTPQLAHKTEVGGRRSDRSHERQEYARSVCCGPVPD